METRPYLILLSILLILSVCQPASAEEFTSKVVSVLDGDTIEVLHHGKPERIKLYGIACPEKGQPFDHRARMFVSDITFKRNFIVNITHIDRFGRSVAIVKFPGGKVLNHEIVKAGFARWDRKNAPDDNTLRALEESAKAAKRGLWAGP